ncbi:MAG: hypothetical protein ACI4XJ_08310 [Eubacteriales bacterium]
MSEQIYLKNDPLLDYIIFNTESGVVLSNLKTQPDDGNRFFLSLLRSMKRGDRAVLNRFCAETYSEDVTQFEILRLAKFCGNSYIFLEKDMVSDNSYTAGFLGKEMTDFIPLMSPDTRLYQTATGRSIYEILLSLSKSKSPRTGTFVTPEMLSLYKKAPLLFDELLSESHNARNCELIRYINTVVKNITENEMFGGVKIELDEGIPSGVNDIFPIYPAALVYMLTSTLHMLAYISAQHRIRIRLCFRDDGAVMDLSCLCDPQLDLASDSSSFSDIGRKYPDLKFTAAVVQALGEGLGFMPTLSYSSGEVSVSMNVTKARAKKVRFKYSDPYSSIPALISESVRFAG